MSRTFQFTVDDLIGVEIEQYIYGKLGCTAPKGLGQVVMAQISHSPLTAAQRERVKAKYQNR